MYAQFSCGDSFLSASCTGCNNNTLMTLEEDHGWIEKREYYWETDVMWLIKRNYGWTGLNAIGMVCSTVIRVKTSETTQESRNPIISISEINNFATSIRRHLSIENQLHRHLDVSFNEEGSHARKNCNYSVIQLKSYC